MKPILCFVDNDEVYLFLIRKMIEKKYTTDKLLEFYNGLEAIEFIKENIEDTHILPDIIFPFMARPTCGRGPQQGSGGVAAPPFDDESDG